jgi:DNA polymerase-3 subunit delta'
MPQAKEYQQLCKFYREGRLSPSLLFVGKKGVGKWSVAVSLAKTITCLEQNDSYCGHCASCKQLDQFAHPDVFFLFPLPQDEKKAGENYLPYLQQKQQHPFSDGSEDVKSFITIESIRKFQNGLAHCSSLSAHKVGIIYEAERMLPGTMDSLLKTLEEPPPNSYLIVVTDQPRFLLPTILSRLRRVNFPGLEPNFIADYLRRYYTIPDSEIGIISRFAAGTLYNIETLVEKEFFLARESAFELFGNALIMPAPDFEVNYYDSAAIDSREKVERLLIYWQTFLRDLMIVHACAESSDTEIIARLVNFDFSERYAEYRDRFHSLSTLEMGVDKLEQIRAQLRRNVNPKMAAFSFLLELGRQG